ncbi:hypothetical protein ACFSKU_11810 [Pontibacter silvestris]|uniref:STAS/SEC14 domain-containing protein n=1 Tax=Pontibacter silvestris TaxID=2305183 RepID=A0ABW4WYW2_9BACT|nr:hypothetical protein [Pontibacter silvestris]MCC9135296.1 hypothetical protein [Pontibacter silvestris]
MRNEILFRDSYILIELNHAEGWIYVNWRGYVNYDTVTSGCEKVLECMQASQCYKILNDNSNVEGPWSAASKFVGSDWIPRMRSAGMECFAWVYSPSTFSRLSMDKALKNTPEIHIEYIRTFGDVEHAMDWLRTC